jgi:sugar phosphate permease
MATKTPRILAERETPSVIIQTETATRMRVWLAAILSFTVFVAYLDRVNVSILIAFPPFLQEMGLKNNPVGQGLLMTFFLVAYGLGNVLLGPVGDRLGPRKAMSIALIFWTVPLLIAANARTVTLLYAAMFILGAGEGLHYPMLSVFVKNWFPREERGKANSAWLVGQMVGPAVGMAAFAAISAVYGWRIIYWLCAFLSMASIPLIWFFTTDRPQQNRWVNKAELEHITRNETLDTGTERIKTGTAWRKFILLIKNPDFCCCAFSFWASVSMVGHHVLAAPVSESRSRLFLGENGIFLFAAVLLRSSGID